MSVDSKNEISKTEPSQPIAFSERNIPENIVSENPIVENIIPIEIVNLTISEVLPISVPMASTKISAFSLSGLKAKKELQEQSKPIQIHDENLPCDDFSEIQMLLYWNEYAQRLGDRGQKIMESLLMMNVPTLSETIITLELPNHGSKLDFDAETPPLLLFFKTEIK